MNNTDKSAEEHDTLSTRDKIMDAALDVFSRKGYHETRMDEIAGESKTSKGSLYFHFPNKEKLFISLVDQFADMLERNVVEAIETSADESTSMDRVQTALEIVLNTFSKYRRPAKILLVQAVGLGSIFEQKRLETSDRFAHLIQTYLDEAIHSNEIEAVDTLVVSHAWMGAIYNVVIQWVYRGEPTQERIYSALLPLLLHSVGYSTTSQR